MKSTIYLGDFPILKPQVWVDFPACHVWLSEGHGNKSMGTGELQWPMVNDNRWFIVEILWLIDGYSMLYLRLMVNQLVIDS